jgi:hypothetical protein
MNENNTIKKMVSGILRGRKNASFDRHIMHPEREWFVVVFIGISLFAAGIAWNISTHLQFKNVAISGTSEVPETIVYRAGLVESALADFGVRKRQYEELKQGLLVRPVAVPVVPQDSTESISDEGTPSVSDNEESTVTPQESEELGGEGLRFD